MDFGQCFIITELNHIVPGWPIQVFPISYRPNQNARFSYPRERPAVKVMFICVLNGMTSTKYFSHIFIFPHYSF